MGSWGGEIVLGEIVLGEMEVLVLCEVGVSRREWGGRKWVPYTRGEANLLVGLGKGERIMELDFCCKCGRRVGGSKWGLVLGDPGTQPKLPPLIHSASSLLPFYLSPHFIALLYFTLNPPSPPTLPLNPKP
jgi:hypothetical protein